MNDIPVVVDPLMPPGEARLGPVRITNLAPAPPDLAAERAVALARCSFLPGHPHKRFAGDCAAIVAAGKPLTERQAAHLARLAWTYRRQMPARLVPEHKIA